MFVAFGILYAKCMRHIVTCGLTSSTILSTLSHRGQDFRKKKSFTIKNFCFNFLYHFVRNIFHSKKNLARYEYKCTLVFMKSTRHSCQILMKLEISREFRNIY
jgi:hypothetical protein